MKYIIKNETTGAYIRYACLGLRPSYVPTAFEASAFTDETQAIKRAGQLSATTGQHHAIYTKPYKARLI